MRTLVTTSLAAAIAAAGIASGWYTTSQAKGPSAIDPSQLVTQKSFDAGTYLVEFEEDGLVQQHLSRTQRSGEPGKKFDVGSVETQEYKNELMAIQADHVSTIRSRVGNVRISHYYLATHSGVALQLDDQAQLDALRALPFVRSVEREAEYELHTHRSATFVGADKIWDGSAGVTATKGEGMVVAILDTGIDVNRPSFANDPACGFGPSLPKIKSYQDCSSTDTSGVCNGTNLTDNEGHGTHVASTAAGNIVTTTQDPALQPEMGDQISGIAPCAQIRGYKVCATDTCSNAMTQAGMNNVLLAGDVDVSNYSIGGGTSPWGASDSDRKKLDMIAAGVLTVASAGNTRPEAPDPVGMVSHRGPWVLTVASSTHDEQAEFLGMSVVGGPVHLQGISVVLGSTVPAYTGGAIEIRRDPSNNYGCTPFPPNYFDGVAALIERGAPPSSEPCSFTIKIQNAYDAGASLVLVRNNQPGTIIMTTTDAPAVPAYSIQQAPGIRLAAHVDENPGTDIELGNVRRAGDILSDFSFRGPTPAPLANLTKPDITAPGDDVYAALPGGYGWMGGTSMSGPQVAGGAALVRAVHPTWTPTEVKSALMLTASTTGTKDGVNGTPNIGPWDADDVGSGRMDLAKAVRAGLVMDETIANFTAANPSSSGDVRTLNLPSMRDMSCTPSCTWTRTVRNTLDTASSWNVSATASGIAISVSPTSFSFAAGDTTQTQVLTITAMPDGNQSAKAVFGQIDLVETGGQSPDLHMTVAARGIGPYTSSPAIAVDPVSVSGTAVEGATTPVNSTLRVSNIGVLSLNWEQADDGAVPLPESVIVDQPQAGNSGIVSHYSTAISGGANTAADFTLDDPTEVTKIDMFGFDNTSSMATVASLTWVVYPDVDDEPSGSFENGHAGAVWQFSTGPNGAGVTRSGTGNFSLDLAAAGQSLTLPAGRYWITAYPTSGTTLATGAPRWNWFMADPAGSTGSKLLGTAFGAPTWRLTGTGGLGTATEDVAFRLSGRQSVQCGAPWLSLNPVSGSVSASGHQDVDVILNPTGLPLGAHKAAICLESNGANEDFTVVPVTFNITPDPATMADLEVNASGQPDRATPGSTVTFLIDLVNHGPAPAEDVEVTLTLPAAISVQSFGASLSRQPAEASVRGTSWDCDIEASPVVCIHTGTLHANAEPLQVTGLVSPSAPEGVVSTTVTVRTSTYESDLDNNDATVLTTIVDFPIFSDDFEPLQIIDSGPITQVVPTGGDKQWNFVTGEFGDYGDFDDADFNLYAGTGNVLMAYFFADVEGSAGQGAVTTGSGGTQVAVLQSGAVVGPASNFTSSGQSNMANWNVGTSGYVGVKFVNESTGQFNYGYVELQTTGTSGLPATVRRIVYNPTGGEITIP